MCTIQKRRVINFTIKDTMITKINIRTEKKFGKFYKNNKRTQKGKIKRFSDEKSKPCQYVCVGQNIALVFNVCGKLLFFEKRKNRSLVCVSVHVKFYSVKNSLF